jgi:hypothetical protein
MSNRQQRRSEIARFRREAAGAHLTTFLVPVGMPLGNYPMLADAVVCWHGQRAVRKPVCIGCRSQLADVAIPGGFLFAVSPAIANAASCSAFCASCWHELSDAAIEAACTNVLRRFVAAGAVCMKPLRHPLVPYYLTGKPAKSDGKSARRTPDNRGHRTPRTQLQIDERDALLREAARRFCAGMSDRQAAAYLRVALLRYREGRWRRTRTEIWNPHAADRLDAVLWRLLRTREAIPSERLIRAVLSRSGKTA